MAHMVNGVSYSYRRALKADTSAIGALTDVALPFIGADLTGKALANMDDVVLTEADGTTLLGSPGGGTFSGWWEDKTLSGRGGHGKFDIAGGSGEEIVAYLYYGGAGASDPSNQAAAYPSSSVAAWALNEASGNLTDATGNGNTGTPYGIAAYGATGRMNGAIQLDGGDETDAEHFARAYAAWVKRSNDTQGRLRSQGAPDWAARLSGNATTTIVQVDDQATTTCYRKQTIASVDASDWVHVCYVVEASGACIIYVNGEAASAESGPYTLSHGLSLLSVGRRYSSPVEALAGVVDHACVVSASTASAGWVKAQYMAGAGALWTWGDEETAEELPVPAYAAIHLNWSEGAVSDDGLTGTLDISHLSKGGSTDANRPSARAQPIPPTDHHDCR